MQNTFIKKITIFYLPFLFLCVGFVLTYNYLYYLLTIKAQIINLQSDFVEFLFPMIMIVCLSFFYYFKVLKKATFKAPYEWNFKLLHSAIFAIFIFVINVLAQHYVEVSSGTFTELNSINDLEKYEIGKYYTTKKSYISSNDFSYSLHRYASTGSTANNNREGEIIDAQQFARRYENRENTRELHLRYDIEMYVVMPFFDSAEDTLKKNVNGWYTLFFSVKVLDPVVEELRDKISAKFIHESIAKLQNSQNLEYLYLERIKDIDNENYKKAAINSSKYETLHYNFFKGERNNFEDRKSNILTWLIVIFITLHLLFLWLISTIMVKEVQY